MLGRSARLIGKHRREYATTSWRHVLGLFRKRDESCSSGKPSNACGTRHRYGAEWKDEYSWLEDDSPHRKRLILEEQARYRKWAGLSGDLIRTLEEDMRHKAQDLQGDGLTEETVGEWTYSSVSSLSARYPEVTRRKRGSEVSMPVINSNRIDVHKELIQQSTHLPLSDGEVDQMKISFDQNLLLYTLRCPSAGEGRVAGVMDIESGELYLEDVLMDVGSVELAADGNTVVFTTLDDQDRPNKVYLHRLGGGLDGREMVLEEKDPSVYVELTRTKDWKYLVVNCSSKTSSEVHLLCAAKPWSNKLVKVRPRQPGVEYFVESQEDQLWILSNLATGREYVLYSAALHQRNGGEDGPLSPLVIGPWQQQLPSPTGSPISTSSRIINDMEVFRSHLVLYETVAGLPAVQVVKKPRCSGMDDREVLEVEEVPLPAGCLSLQPAANQDYHSPTCRIQCCSPVDPGIAYDYDFNTQQLVAHQGRASASSSYTTIRMQAKGEDGVCIPLTVCHSLASPLSGPRPFVMMVYGAYGLPADLSFNPCLLTLLDQGWVAGFAHVRGGGELGRSWHEAGRTNKKKNSALDFLSCVSHVVEAGLTAPGLIAGHSFSAGALALGAAVNLEPHWFGCLVLRQPFVDLLTTMTDTELPLTAHEYEEWGEPGFDPGVLLSLMSICPYHNLHQAEYPPAFITCAEFDARVPPWGPLKYAMRLREVNEQADPEVVVKYIEGWGHGDLSVTDVAEEYAFMMQHCRQVGT